MLKDINNGAAKFNLCDVDQGFLYATQVSFSPMSREFEERRSIVPQREVTVGRQNPTILAFVEHVTGGQTERRETLVALSRRYELPFLAWEVVRNQRAGEIVQNPLLPSGIQLPRTGLEGYFVGTGMDPRAVVTAIADYGKNIYDRTVARDQAAGDYQSAQALLRTAKGDPTSPTAFLELNRHFGALLGRLRSQSYENPTEYDTFRLKTYETAQTLLANYRENPMATDSLIPSSDTPALRTHLQPTQVDLTAQQQKGYFFLAQMGTLGHPLIRAGIELQRGQ